MDRVGIVGAGVSGAGAAYALAQRAPDVDVTVFEASDRVGGRAASRTRADCIYDYGANYLKADDERVMRLVTETLDTTGLVDVAEPVDTFDASGTVSPGRDADDHKWTYESGLRELPRRLFDATDARIFTEMPIDTLARESDGWRLRSPDLGHGPFDAVVLTPPAPDTAALLRDADWNDEARNALVDALAAVDYRTIYSAALHYPFAIDRPYYALVNTDRKHAVSWLSREESKRGHVPDGRTLLIVQAAEDWSVEHADDPPAANAERLAGNAASILDDDRLDSPDWTDHHCWTHALPDGEVPAAAVQAARDDALYVVGDAIAGEGRIHAALRSGLEAGDQLATGP
jgi:renalase